MPESHEKERGAEYLDRAYSQTTQVIDMGGAGQTDRVSKAEDDGVVGDTPREE